MLSMKARKTIVLHFFDADTARDVYIPLLNIKAVKEVSDNSMVIDVGGTDTYQVIGKPEEIYEAMHAACYFVDMGPPGPTEISLDAVSVDECDPAGMWSGVRPEDKLNPFQPLIETRMAQRKARSDKHSERQARMRARWETPEGEEDDE